MTLDDIIAPGTKPEVLGRGYGFTEGPTADRDGNVFFSDGQNNSIYRWRPGDCPNFRRDPGKGDSPIFAETKIGTVPENGTVPLGPRPAITLFTDDSTDAIGMMFNAAGELYVCEGAAHRIVAFDLKTGPLSPWERARVRAGSVEDARMLPSLPAPLPKGEGSCPGDGPNFSPLSSWERARVRAGSAENAGIRPSPPAPLPEGEGSCPGVPLDAPKKATPRPPKRILCSEIDGQHFNEPNDLAIDFHGGFYFSDPNYQHRGQPTVMKQDVYYCSADGRVTRVSTVCFKPNGVRLSADDRTLYVADARGQRIYRYDVIGPGQLAGERIWIDRLAANPDGMTLDEYDNLYVCCGKAGLKIFDRDARPIGRIEVHAANCCFGAPDFRTLCIASADKFRALRTNVTGMKPLAVRIRQ